MVSTVKKPGNNWHQGRLHVITRTLAFPRLLLGMALEDRPYALNLTAAERNHWLTLYDTGLRLSGAPLPGTDWPALVDPTRAGFSFWLDERSASIQQALKSVTPMTQTYLCNPKMMYYPLEHPKQNPIPQQEPGLHHIRSPANAHRALLRH